MVCICNENVNKIMLQWITDNKQKIIIHSLGNFYMKQLKQTILKQIIHFFPFLKSLYNVTLIIFGLYFCIYIHFIIYYIVLSDLLTFGMVQLYWMTT